MADPGEPVRRGRTRWERLLLRLMGPPQLGDPDEPPPPARSQPDAQDPDVERRRRDPRRL